MPVGEYRLKRRVHFHETDGAAIVHFSRYFAYLEEAEHALWRAAGLSIALPGSEIGWPRVQAAFDYHAPLRFEDEFEVLIRIVAIETRKIRYTCRLTRGETKIASGTLTIVCVSHQHGQAMRAISIPPHVRERLCVAPEPEA